MIDDKSDEFERLRVRPGTVVRLDDWNTRWISSGKLKDLDEDDLKDEAKKFIEARVEEVADSQELLWADNRYAMLLVFQGMDAAGKDGTIEHVMEGVNPAGVRVVSFKEPSREDLDHDFLWRYVKALPEYGQIGVFNRSYYEDVGVVRVFPELLEQRAMHDREVDDTFWAERFEDINVFERHLVRNGTIVLKFFLHVSRKEQKHRLLDRLDDPDKHWKFSASDLKSREHWDEYARVFESMLTYTSTGWAPWWVIPADGKWAMRAIVAKVLTNEIRRLDLRFPPADDAKRALMRRAREALERE